MKSLKTIMFQRKAYYMA